MIWVCFVLAAAACIISIAAAVHAVRLQKHWMTMLNFVLQEVSRMPLDDSGGPYL